jgi:hypothetical protein
MAAPRCRSPLPAAAVSRRKPAELLSVSYGQQQPNNRERRAGIGDWLKTKERFLLLSYRRDETHNPEVYSSAVSAVLADGYSPEIVDYVTDPRTGLPSRKKFLPSVAEVREACDERSTHVDRIKRYETLKAVPPREVPIVPGQITYREFLEHCKATGARPRPIGAFEPGGYLGPARNT